MNDTLKCFEGKPFQWLPTPTSYVAESLGDWFCQELFRI
jgi:hypothetical protein